MTVPSAFVHSYRGLGLPFAWHSIVRVFPVITFHVDVWGFTISGGSEKFKDSKLKDNIPRLEAESTLGRLGENCCHGEIDVGASFCYCAYFLCIWDSPKNLGFLRTELTKKGYFAPFG